jgi:hypothetical protein
MFLDRLRSVGIIAFPAPENQQGDNAKNYACDSISIVAHATLLPLKYGKKKKG